MAGRNTLNTLSTLDTIPLSTTLTGTVSSNGVTVTGTGTDFQELVRTGIILTQCTYLFSDDESEVRQIISVSDNLQVLTIDSPFSSDLVGDDFKIVTPEHRMITISAVGDITVDGVQLLDGQTLTVDLTGQGANTKINLVDPFVVDPGSNTAKYITRI